MNEQFDRTLRNHIRDTFDHYDDLMADDGWNKFQKQKNRKKRGLILWYALPSGIAAALTLLWIFNIATNNAVQPTGKNIAQHKASKPIETISKGSNETVESSSAFGKQAHTPTTALKKEIKPTINQNKSVENIVSISATNSRAKLSLVSTHQINFNSFKADDTAQGLLLDEYSFKNRDAQKIDNRTYLAFKTDLLKNTDIYPKSATSPNKKEEKKKNNSLNFAVDANTFYSFTSTGLNNDLNLGIGVLSELKLSKYLSINSGISINRQSAVYQNSEQSGGSQGFASPPESPNASISQIGKQSISVSEGVRTNAKLVGFDIPINLKYNIPLGKVKTFISTGVSSYSLLNQSYVNDLSVINYSLTSAPTTTVLRSVEEEQDPAFSNFQFARTVNFSFGVLYPVSSKNSISVEPFVKYPIAGFGNRDLEIGSGGISFKLNFGK
ncbi:hypothetical protein [Pedobacter arcticus]|uniref:hypothetical protein n=1 Tax=Pedobacter arcticus TaxID=752140 RepID=UPI00031F85B0|nr:hypothetical protein [Pedobacter arcticus]